MEWPFMLPREATRRRTSVNTFISQMGELRPRRGGAGDEGAVDGGLSAEAEGRAVGLCGQHAREAGARARLGCLLPAPTGR